jgi:hypothetical protein
MGDSMAKKSPPDEESGGHGGMKLEQLHACVNQIPAGESGLHLLNAMKREMVICTVGGFVVRTYAIGSDIDCQHRRDYLDNFHAAADAGSGTKPGTRPGVTITGRVLRRRPPTDKFC